MAENAFKADWPSFALGFNAGKSNGGGGAELNIAYGDTPPEDTSKLWTKTSKASRVIVSPDKVFTEGGQDESAELFTIKTGNYQGVWASVGTDCYIFGYRTLGSSNASATIYKFNTITRVYSTLSAKLPVALLWQSVAVYGKKVYLFGGRTADYGTSGSVSSSIVEFDADTLEAKALDTTLPSAVGGSCCAVVGNKAYIFGGDITGSTTGKFVDYAFVFDFETKDVRLSKNQLPKASSFMACGAIGDKIYLFGGLEGRREILRFDTIDETFTKLEASLPGDRHVMGSATINDEIFLFGGNDSTYTNVSSFVNTVWRFNESNNKITECLPVPVDYPNQMNVAAVGTKIYGRGSFGSTTSNAYFFEYAPMLGSQLLDHDTLQIYPAWERNEFNIIDSDNLKIPVGVDMVHRGNENGESIKVEALLYKNGAWTPI